MFYDRFKRLCFEKGVSEMKAATDIGLSTSTTWKWRTGATPRFETLKKLAAYFDVSPEYFLENGNDKGNQITDSQIASGNIGTVIMTKNGPAPSQQGTGASSLSDSFVAHRTEDRANHFPDIKEKAPCVVLRKVPFPHQKKRKRSMKNTGWNAPRAAR